MTIGIYKITNIVNGKVYIGKSQNIEKRFNTHISDLNHNRGHNSHFQNAWNKYAQDNFKFEIIHTLDTYDEKEISNLEIYYISKYDATNPKYGYNFRCGGQGGKLSERQKMIIKEQSKFKNASLSEEDVRLIKLMLYCLMDRKEIAKMFNVKLCTIKSIAEVKTYYYVCEELNDKIKGLKQKLIDERNEKILESFDSGKRIIDIINETGYSESIVSKCVHKYRKIENKYYNDDRIKIYNDIMRLYNIGHEIKDICEELNQPRTTVARYVGKDFDIENKKHLPFKKVTKEIEDDIINSYFNNNESVKEIYKRLNLSRTTVETYINKHKYANTEITN